MNFGSSCICHDCISSDSKGSDCLWDNIECIRRKSGVCNDFFR